MQAFFAQFGVVLTALSALGAFAIVGIAITIINRIRDGVAGRKKSISDEKKYAEALAAMNAIPAAIHETASKTVQWQSPVDMEPGDIFHIPCRGRGNAHSVEVAPLDSKEVLLRTKPGADLSLIKAGESLEVMAIIMGKLLSTAIVVSWLEEGSDKRHDQHVTLKRQSAIRYFDGGYIESIR